MRRFLLVALLGALALGCSAASTGPGGRPDAGGSDSAVPPPANDADGDGISDFHEGRAEGVDTDGDGTPDYLDDDSDNDNISDEVEGATNNMDVPPRDSDFDGTPDFRDSDSDNNGIPDLLEGGADTDGDRDPDFRDSDNDGDSISDVEELGPDPSSPVDFDGDGLADFLDPDSDNDTINDLHEGIPADTDGDDVPDRHDLDSDNDGISDRDEAGDNDPLTPPVDTDGDLTPDFRDPDSDDDGLSDQAELAAGTSPTHADSDGDGVTDLVEVAAGTDALDATDSPRERGDFVFFEPYMMPADPPRDTLDFATNLQFADVYFIMDNTGSMGISVSSLRSSLSTFIPMVRTVIPNVQVGIGAYKDYPVSPYGSSGDFAYRNFQNITADDAAAVASMASFTSSGGNDGPESLVPALWAIATGSRLVGNSGLTGDASCPGGTFGYPCFREGAVPIVVGITDVTTHNGPGGANGYSDAALGGHAPTFDEAVSAMNAVNMKFIGIGQGTGGAAHLQAVSTGTGSVDGGGSPLYSTWSGGAIGDTVLNQIRTLANSSQLDISIQFVDEPSDGVDSFAAFVDHLEANQTGDAARGCEPRSAVDSNGDGFADTFPNVTAGSRVCFDIVVKQNDTVEPTREPQLFRATLRVIGDGFTELDSRDVYFLVPPRIEIPEGPL